MANVASRALHRRDPSGSHHGTRHLRKFQCLGECLFYRVGDHRDTPPRPCTPQRRLRLPTQPRVSPTLGAPRPGPGWRRHWARESASSPTLRAAAFPNRNSLAREALWTLNLSFVSLGGGAYRLKINTHFLWGHWDLFYLNCADCFHSSVSEVLKAEICFSALYMYLL